MWHYSTLPPFGSFVIGWRYSDVIFLCGDKLVTVAWCNGCQFSVRHSRSTLSGPSHWTKQRLVLKPVKSGLPLARSARKRKKLPNSNCILTDSKLIQMLSIVRRLSTRLRDDSLELRGRNDIAAMWITMQIAILSTISPAYCESINLAKFHNVAVTGDIGARYHSLFIFQILFKQLIYNFLIFSTMKPLRSTISFIAVLNGCFSCVSRGTLSRGSKV